MDGQHRDVDDEFVLDSRSPKKHRAKVAKRLSGRPSCDRNNSSKASAADSPLLSIMGDDTSQSSSQPHRHDHYSAEGLRAQVSAWLKQEKARRAERKSKRHDHSGAEAAAVTEDKPRRSSNASDSSIALDSLENILEKSLSIVSNEARKVAHVPHRRRKPRRHSTAASSDTEYYDGDVLVPSCDAVLDNSKTLAYTGGQAADSDIEEMTPGTRKASEKQAWTTFKYEIVRLAHTLRLKGWRRVPMERSSDIEVERLSGALTNAVYVVSPPRDLPPRAPRGEHASSGITPTNPPPKLLMRIYGPQVEHLIDRESELQILRRLARKRIGPRLLGTFTNGRFEEFFHARTLTNRDLRVPETSKQIAKRMRELHEGIDLLQQEREDGPFVWRNWDKWVDRCETIAKWLDQQIITTEQDGPRSNVPSWKKRGFVCGVEWKVFRQTVERYRQWLEEQYGGKGKVNDRLVFAHNDTQYGNILRLVPAGESPLLLPANEHKQLVVIDFEYANANTPGLEFANHFTEWCYNYHDANLPWAINTAAYPTPTEQHRFIRAYVIHRPHPSLSTTTSPSMTPSAGTTPGFGPTTPDLRPSMMHSSSISTFMLDSRAPPQAMREAEEREERETEQEVQRLMAETRLWRMANSAQWITWGIVQAKIPGMPDKEEDEGYMTQHHQHMSADQGTDPLGPEEAAMAEDFKNDRPEDGDEEEFDYLGYAQERAMFFWGDAVRLGIVSREELPQEWRERVKVVDY
ncbi:kinase-like protein [Saccharata proteae CBS 121410]|uniref:Kinase-like protein n=1 Tax=Saccharata proteae CBS 121410 TaxID=1314787 RepID=A0A9P4LUJ2_9PEZI|nr:kinase-like protein [Saccharata proteae CBS 121410]